MRRGGIVHGMEQVGRSARSAHSAAAASRSRRRGVALVIEGEVHEDVAAARLIFVLLLGARRVQLGGFICVQGNEAVTCGCVAAGCPATIDSLNRTVH